MTLLLMYLANRDTFKKAFSKRSETIQNIQWKQHNYKVSSTTETDRLCDCRNKENCPLDGKFCKHVSFTRLM